MFILDSITEGDLQTAFYNYDFGEDKNKIKLSFNLIYFFFKLLHQKKQDNSFYYEVRDLPKMSIVSIDIKPMNEFREFIGFIRYKRNLKKNRKNIEKREK